MRRFACLSLLLLVHALRGEDLPSFEFSRSGEAAEWKAAHDVELSAKDGRLVASITGSDPYFIGPFRDYPAGTPLWMILDLFSETAGGGQVFWAGPQPDSEERSVRFFVPGRTDAIVRVPVPTLAPHTRLRLDPPGTSGTCRIRSIRFEPRPVLSGPEWQPVGQARIERHPGRLSSGPLSVIHDAAGPGHFLLKEGEQVMATGHTNAPVGYQVGGETRWFTLGSPLPGRGRFQRTPTLLSLETLHADPDGGTWTFVQEFRRTAAGISFESRVSVDRDRKVVFVPALLVLPGVGSFGTNKQQGLLAGIEYLGNEESSSERDLVGPQALRQVPAPWKFTFPLMALAAGDRWISLGWEPAPELAALHDSPDRITRSGGHLFGLIHPGADGARRQDGSLLPYEGLLLKAGTALTARATLAAGTGDTVVPAVRAHLTSHRLPPLPSPIPEPVTFYRLAARGWLDSGIRDGARYRHAIGGGFEPGVAPDAGYYEGWLAPRVRDNALAERLILAARENRDQVPGAAWMTAQVGHLKLASPGLSAGQGAALATGAPDIARRHLAMLGADTRVRFHSRGGARDLGSTHWEDHANGLTATHLSIALDHALLSGDRRLVDECLRHVRRLEPAGDGVPRGAQTWEVPLHTPDILASAYLLKVNVTAYELTGDSLFLARARYWAWSGIPFVYLHAPGPGEVGVYSTTPVLGATQFVAPNWIGLPVQWCGIVYADALLRLAPHDRSLDWGRVARGIALAGVQHTHPESDGPAMGCLPDSFDLVAQARNPVPINPGTLLPIAAVAYGEKPMQGFAAAPNRGTWVVAAGPVRLLSEDARRIRFRLDPPAGQPSDLLVGGAPADAAYRWKGKAVKPSEVPGVTPGRALLRLEGSGELMIEQGD